MYIAQGKWVGLHEGVHKLVGGAAEGVHKLVGGAA